MFKEWETTGVRGPLCDSGREQLALGTVYEAARALEALAEIRHRFEALKAVLGTELPLVEGAFAHSFVALVRLTSSIEKLEAAAEREAEALGD